MAQTGQPLPASEPAVHELAVPELTIPPRELELLNLALRSRPTTVGELSTMVLEDPAELREQLDTLAALGLLTREGERIGYRPPDRAVGELASGLLASAEQQLTTSLSSARALLDALPRLLASAAVGADGMQSLGAELFHGPHAAVEAWRAHITAQSVRLSACVLPEARPVLEAGSPLSELWSTILANDEMSVRAILSASDLARPEAQQMREVAASTGVEFRAVQRPPSWFWLTDEVAGLPLRWGDSWPTSAFAVRNEAIVSLLHWVFDTMWAQATPLTPAEHPWDPIVALMADGATLETAAQAVGLSARTGRRRLEAAMDYYGVSGAVALGAAWQQERG